MPSNDAMPDHEMLPPNPIRKWSGATQKPEPDLPSSMHMISGALSAAKDVVFGIVKDVANLEIPHPFSDNEEYERRLAICRSCEHFRLSDERCGSPDAQKNWGCGCYVSDHETGLGVKAPGKARFRDAHCPLTPPKW